MSTVAYGSFESALDRVKRTLLALAPNERLCCLRRLRPGASRVRDAAHAGPA